MWLKSAVRQLAKWVPTSAEYRREQLRAAQDVLAERAHHESRIPTVVAGDGEHVDPLTGEVMEAPDEPDVMDAEVVNTWTISNDGSADTVWQQILTEGRGRRLTPAQIEERFVEWAKGIEARDADATALAAFLHDMKAGA